MTRIAVTYQVRCAAASADARAHAIAVEQSVEMPVDAIDDPLVLNEILGEVLSVRDLGAGLFEVQIGLAVATLGEDAGQMLNMLFGNASIYDDVTLADVEFTLEFCARFGGPNHGLDGLRGRKGRRALTCAALKPQGLSADALASLAGRLARGGIDFIKDDHGLANQAYSPFVARVAAVARSVRQANAVTGLATRYAPNVSGDLVQLRRQIRFAIEEGVDAVLIEPMIVGLSNFHRVVRDFPQVAFITHPAMAGAARISPPLLLGKIFRMLGADATVYPNYGGRFGYSAETCGAIADAAREPWLGLKSCVPTPAGGMTLDRVPELLHFYGPDTMLLIGGSLLATKERLTEETSAFTARVASYFGNNNNG